MLVGVGQEFRNSEIHGEFLMQAQALRLDVSL